MGTTCRKRTTSATNGFGTSRRRNTSKYVHTSCTQSHIPQPQPIRAQNSCVFLSLLLMFERIDTVPQKRRTHCVRSPNAVSPMLRGASSVTEMWRHTTAHTIPVHLLACRTEIKPTLRVYVSAQPPHYYGSNGLPRYAPIQHSIRSQKRIAGQTGKHRRKSCRGGRAQRGRCLALASRRLCPRWSAVRTTPDHLSEFG